MGHLISQIERMCRGIVYQQKTTQEIREALKSKIKRVKQLLEERESRVAKICQEFEINVQELTNLVLQYQDAGSQSVSYEAQSGARTVPAGAIANIIQEKKMTESERGQLRKLELVERNLMETERYRHPKSGEVLVRECIHELDDEELEYFGF